MKMNKMLHAKSVNLKSIKSKLCSTRVKNVGIILLIALTMFSATYLLQSLISSTNLSVGSGEVSDWAFVSGIKDEQVRAENAVFKQATKNAPVNASRSKPYTHLYYTFDASKSQRSLTVYTNHAPVKAEIGAAVIYDNGYKKADIVGNCYNEIIIPASDSAQTVHIYMYSPMEFKFFATVSQNRVLLNVPLLFGFMIIGMGIIFLIAALCFKSDEVIKAVMISVGNLIFGMYVCIYALQNTSMYLNTQHWYNISVALSIFAAAFCYFDIMFLSGTKRTESKVLLGAMAVIAAALIFVPYGFFFKALIFVCALVQCALAAAIFIENEATAPFTFKGEKLIITLIAYFVIINIFGELSKVFGFAGISENVLIIGVLVMNVLLYIYFMKYVAVPSMIDGKKDFEAEYFSGFCKDTSNLMANLYTTNSHEEFIEEFCRDIVPIIKRNREVAVVGEDICYCTAIGTDGNYTQLNSVNTDEEPDFAAMADNITDGECIIGSSYIGVKFKSGKHESAVAYIGNIAVPFESSFKNYFAALCNSSQAVFMNNNLESELIFVEEKLFINLAKIVETRSNETSRHLNNVGLMTQIICSQLGYSDSESRLIATASMTHDIGKVAVPDAVLNKKGEYTFEERDTMKKHTVYGYNILSVSNGRFFEIAAKIAKEHHENYDGSGYLGIKGEQIDRYARIVRVVDTFDALVSERCYKHAWSVEEAVSYINEKSGIEFDPEIVEAFNVCKDDMISVRK